VRRREQSAFVIVCTSSSSSSPFGKTASSPAAGLLAAAAASSVVLWSSRESSGVTVSGPGCWCSEEEGLAPSRRTRFFSSLAIAVLLRLQLLRGVFSFSRAFLFILSLSRLGAEVVFVQTVSERASDNERAGAGKKERAGESERARAPIALTVAEVEETLALSLFHFHFHFSLSLSLSLSFFHFSLSPWLLPLRRSTKNNRQLRLLPPPRTPPISMADLALAQLTCAAKALASTATATGAKTSGAAAALRAAAEKECVFFCRTGLSFSPLESFFPFPAQEQPSRTPERFQTRRNKEGERRGKAGQRWCFDFISQSL